MAKVLEKLSPLGVSRLKAKGMYHDGGGLYLRVKDDGGKSWAFRYTLHGKAREMGLGGFPAISLADAREAAGECRKLITKGDDPIKHRNEVQVKAKLASAKDKTFKECAEAYIDAHKSGWRNAKHAQQWGNTLEAYAYPILGDISIADIGVTEVMNVLKQKKAEFGKGATFWTARTETANRVRGRIEAVLGWATSCGYRTGENAARWRGHLENLLPSRTKVQRVQHQPALPYSEVGDFMAALREQNGEAAKALQFAILTASRTSEVIGATWDEFDLDNKVWTIPAERIKAGREHRVALSDKAAKLLGDAQGSGFVFGGQRKGKPLSNMAMLTLLKRMKKTDITVHGFRSSFRDWAAEQTNYPREVAEACLAHISGDKVESAYLRTDFMDKRRKLMDAWAKYCATPSQKASGNVFVMRGNGRR